VQRRTDKDAVDVMVVGARVSAGRWRRLVELVESDLYLAVEQPSRALVVDVQSVESLDVHPQRQQTSPRCVGQVLAELTHARHAAERFRHPTDDVTAHRRRPQPIICTNNRLSNKLEIVQTFDGPLPTPQTEI